MGRCTYSDMALMAIATVDIQIVTTDQQTMDGGGGADMTLAVLALGMGNK